MERDWGSPYPYRQSPDLNSMSTQLDFKHQQTNFSGYINHCANMAVPNDNGTLPVNGFSNEPHGWFYGLPQYRQAFTPVLNPSTSEKANIGSLGNSNEPAVPNSVYNCAEKSFLVFDQTGDQTTLIFSSEICNPIKFPTSWNPNLPNVDHLIGNQPGHKSEPLYNLDQILIDEVNEESEMHEDTEELNALLYSDEDDSDYSDEVTSKDHTPSTMTFHDSQELFNECVEQVASSDEPHSDVPSLTNPACSMKRKRSVSSEYKDDAQSTCAQSDDMIFASFSKKSKKERIRDTVSLLQSIIPCGEGKTAIDILDEAIAYLQSLKLKVKNLGLNTL